MQANKNKQKRFASFKEYREYLEHILLQYPKAKKVILETAGEEVEKNAKSKFGNYQEAIGPFDKWEELADSTKADRVRQGYSENEPLLREGDLRDSISRSVEEDAVSVGSTSEIMVYQELGTKNIKHPRAAIGPAMFEKKARIQALCGEVMFAWLTDQVEKVK